MNSKGKIIGVNGNMISVEVTGQVSMNEVGYVLVSDKRLKSEVIRVRGNQVEMQVFEMTGGIGIGDEVDFTGEMLAVELGPGLLTQIYDGLQNPLPELAEEYGFFIQRGVYFSALDAEKKWSFTPSVKTGDTVSCAETLGVAGRNIRPPHYGPL